MNQFQTPEVPEKVWSYTKFKEGTTKLRILWNISEWWMDRTEEEVNWKLQRKSLRYRKDEKPTIVYDPKWLRYFWALPVFNYDTRSVQIREITQKSIMNKIKKIVADPERSDIFGYDIKVSREWQSLETKYDITTSVPTPLSAEISQAYMDAEIDMEAIFDDLSPIKK